MLVWAILAALKFNMLQGVAFAENSGFTSAAK
jgi:hypothetical protein